MSRDPVIESKFKCKSGIHVSGDSLLAGDSTTSGDALIRGDLTVLGSVNFAVTNEQTSYAELVIKELNRHPDLIDVGLNPDFNQPITVNSELAVTEEITWLGGDTISTNAAVSVVQDTSGNWDYVYSDVSVTSGDWNSVYTDVSTNSANWDGTYTTVGTYSGDWEDAHTSVLTTSSNWDSVYTDVGHNRGNWDGTYTTVGTYSGDWEDAHTSVLTTSSNWDSVYTDVGHNRGNWDTAYGWGDHSLAGYITDSQDGTINNLTITGDIDIADPGTTDWTPNDLAAGVNMMWFDASDASSITETSGHVSRWKDLTSTTGQSDFFERNTTNSGSMHDTLQNGLSTIHFDQDDFMAQTANAFTPPGDGNMTCYILARIPAGRSNSVDSHGSDSILCYDAPNRDFQIDAAVDTDWQGRVNATQVGPEGTNQSTGTPGTATTDWAIFRATFNFDTSEITLHINDTQVGITGVYDVKINEPGLWRVFTNRSKAREPVGQVAEIIVVNDVTTDTTDRVTGYLAHKWGIDGSLPGAHTYKDSAPTSSNNGSGGLNVTSSVIWDGGDSDKANSVYSTVHSYSGDWEDTHTTVGTNSANWDSTYTDVSTNSANWDTAYGWGDHAGAGYILSTTVVALEQSAAASAETATAAETSVTTLFDNFDDRFLGTKATNPSVDNDGNALSVGAVYYNSTDKEVRFYNGATWDRPEHSASTSATNAATSETNAATSETNAATSATNAAGSATNAATSETNAATSATNAAGSATNAATSETNAATSETNAATSATNAAGSATNAATSETNAATSETNAATSATNAAGSATNAATSETNASGSASTASGYATTAQQQAEAASADASAAAGSASTASGHASTASSNAGYAEEWANKAEDTNVSTAAGGGSSSYSAKHWAAKAAASASSASSSEQNASSSASSITSGAVYGTLTVAGHSTYSPGTHTFPQNKDVDWTAFTSTHATNSLTVDNYSSSTSEVYVWDGHPQRLTEDVAYTTANSRLTVTLDDTGKISCTGSGNVGQELHRTFFVLQR